MASKLKEPHVVIFPFMAQGHTLPLLDLSKALSQRHIKVTIITTPSNSISISNYIPNYPSISLAQIPFPSIPGLPKGCENTTQLPSMEFFLTFLQATKHLQKPFEQVLRQMSESNTLPICVISDFFLGWTLAPCKALGIPRLVFHGMGVFSMAVAKTAWVQAESHETNSITESDPMYLPGIEIPFVLTGADLPEGINTPHHDDPYSQFLAEAAKAEINSWGVVVNSFLELEGNFVSPLESFYQNGAKAWCLGPLCLYDDSEECFHGSLDRHQHEVIMKWLDEHTLPASVIFVCFGTQAHIPPAQLDEVAYGLEDAKVPFLWVVRSDIWSLPDGMEERVKGKGLIIREWVDQPAILKHSAIGGFFSHCGWNSILESLSVGVPILAWPMIAEQALNARLVVEGLHVGVGIEKMQGADAKVIGVSREAICRGVKELMEGCQGRIARDESQTLGEVARQAVKEAGSSYLSLRKLIDQLCAS
ncbi:UDP-glycosyltransferase 90A1-like [Rhododendron vialii]|uniref:UDP-glycosyltransferase 90A1-like n=1 Tax=Rhododendron vialii TaxID=182163 RepID=UPI00265EF382|nr:UDP-glycosyltransferase 90A1-like [Rhododendron vialii]